MLIKKKKEQIAGMGGFIYIIDDTNKIHVIN